MTVAFDAITEQIRTDTTDPQTWTHTPVGTPRAVVVAICHNTSATDHVSTVTYGGVSLAEGTAAVTTIELGRVEVWHLGTAIPTGAQTVSVDLSSATTDDFSMYSLTFTAAADTEVVALGAVTGLGNVTGGTATMSVGGREAMAVGIYFTGRANPTDVTLGSGITSLDTNAFGANASVTARQTSVSTSNFDFSGTQPSDDFALAVLSIAEVADAGVTGTGALSLASTTTSGTGAETFTGTGALSLATTTVSGTGAETFTGTGALSLASATVSGTGAETFTGTGALTLASATLAGSGLHIEPVTGTGALTLAGIAISGGVTGLPGYASSSTSAALAALTTKSTGAAIASTSGNAQVSTS